MIYKVKARRLELSALIDLKARPKDLMDWLPENLSPLPRLPNTALNHDNYFVYWISEDHWLLRTSIDRESNLVERLNLSITPDHISAVVISDTLVFFELTGPEADQIISIASPIDIHISVFPYNGVTFTEVFGLKGLLIRTETGFELAIDRSYADTLQDYLGRAGADFE